VLRIRRSGLNVAPGTAKPGSLGYEETAELGFQGTSCPSKNAAKNVKPQSS
jgi:hypothetical protein